MATQYGPEQTISTSTANRGYFSFEELHSILAQNNGHVLGCFDEMSSFYGQLVSSIGFLMRLSAAVFFSPFRAAIMNHRILCSCHSGLLFTNAFVPMKEAVAVSSGEKINSGGALLASAFAVIILCRSGLSAEVKSC